MSFYEGKKVVVVGGAGLVGHQLVRQLAKRGAIVTVLDNMSRGKQVSSQAQYMIEDAGKPAVCQHAFYGAFAVFNLAAAVAGVLHNQGHHTEMYGENIRLLTTPVRVAEEMQIPHYLAVSSVCIYSPENNAPAVEDKGFDGIPHPANAGYAEAKRDGERLVQWSNLPHAIIVRPSNVLGEADYFDERSHVIPALIKKAVHDDMIRVFGSPDITREFIYSGDVAAGMIAAVEFGAHKRVYNLGTNGNTCVSLRELAMLIRSFAPDTEKRIVFDEGQGGGDQARWSDSHRANHELNWVARVDLVEAVRRTANWYLENEVK